MEEGKFLSYILGQNCINDFAKLKFSEIEVRRK